MAGTTDREDDQTAPATFERTTTWSCRAASWPDRLPDGRPYIPRFMWLEHGTEPEPEGKQRLKVWTWESDDDPAPITVNILAEAEGGWTEFHLTRADAASLARFLSMVAGQ